MQLLFVQDDTSYSQPSLTVITTDFNSEVESEGGPHVKPEQEDDSDLTSDEHGVNLTSVSRLCRLRPSLIRDEAH